MIAQLLLLALIVALVIVGARKGLTSHRPAFGGMAKVPFTGLTAVTVLILVAACQQGHVSSPGTTSSVSAAPSDTVSAAPSDTVSPAPSDTVSPAPSDTVSPAPSD